MKRRRDDCWINTENTTFLCENNRVDLCIFSY